MQESPILEEFQVKHYRTMMVIQILNAGKLKGNENGELMLTTDMMRILVILDRYGFFG